MSAAGSLVRCEWHDVSARWMLVDSGQAVLQSCAVITEASVAASAWQPLPDANDIGSTLLKYLRLIVGTEMMCLVQPHCAHLTSAAALLDNLRGAGQARRLCQL